MKIEDLANFILVDAKEISLNIIDTYSTPIMDITDDKSPASTSTHQINSLSKHNDEELSCTLSQQLAEQMKKYTNKNTDSEREIMRNDDITYKHIDLPSSNAKKSIKSSKNSEAIAKDDTIKSTQLINSLQEQLKTTNKELKAKNVQLTDMKMKMLRSNLDSQFMKTNATIQNRITFYSYQYSIIEKIQNTLMDMLGTQLSLDHRDWSEPIKELQKIGDILERTYHEKLAEINSAERCKDINDVRLDVPHLPTLPNQNISEFLRVAFHMYYSHFQRLISTPKPIPNSYSRPFIADASIFMSSYQDYRQYHDFFPQEQSRQPFMSHFSSNRSHFPTQRGAVPRSNTAQARYELEQWNRRDTGQRNDVAMASYDEHRILNLLRSRNKGVLEYDLMWTLDQVQKKLNSSLTEIPLSVIIDESERLLFHWGKLQLADYSENSNENVSRNLPNYQQQRKTTVSSTSSQDSTNSNSKKLTAKKNPWNIIEDSFLPWNSSNIQEECVICFEMLRSDIKTNPTYILQCKHTFHKKCIDNWFKENRSCPTCRKYSTMDDEFPPL